MINLESVQGLRLFDTIFNYLNYFVKRRKKNKYNSLIQMLYAGMCTPGFLILNSHQIDLKRVHKTQDRFFENHSKKEKLNK